MKQIIYKFICDESGDEILVEAEKIDQSNFSVPEGWGIYIDENKKEYHFSSLNNWNKFWKKEEKILEKEKRPRIYQDKNDFII